MSAASLVLAAVIAWGPVTPVSAPSPAPVIEPPADAATPSPSPAPAPSSAPSLQPAFIAKAPLDARARPILVAAPGRARRERPPLYKQWLFWVVAGGLFASTIAATIIVTRPHEQPYTGNIPPYAISFP